MICIISRQREARENSEARQRGERTYRRLVTGHLVYKLGDGHVFGLGRGWRWCSVHGWPALLRIAGGQSLSCHGRRDHPATHRWVPRISCKRQWRHATADAAAGWHTTYHAWHATASHGVRPARRWPQLLTFGHRQTCHDSTPNGRKECSLAKSFTSLGESW
jgi:hypothetical protein